MEVRLRVGSEFRCEDSIPMASNWPVGYAGAEGGHAVRGGVPMNRRMRRSLLTIAGRNQTRMPHHMFRVWMSEILERLFPGRKKTRVVASEL